MQLGHDKSSLGLSNSATFFTFLDKKDKSTDIDSDKRWTTTWNDYLGDIK